MDNPKKQFSKIYDNYIEKIYRFVFLKVSSSDIAEDLTSETFLRGWKAFEKDPVSIENPQAFLYQVARNLIADFYRDKNKVPLISAEFVQIEDPQPNMEEKAKLDSDMEIVHQALLTLKDDYQNVVIWHYLDGLPIQEVAQLLGKSEKTTRVTLHRALKSIKTQIKQKTHLI
jgi:RNA polymerase sigma-70 factor (ECF subfamily)